MQDQSKGSWARDPAIVERSIVLELLRDDHEQWWTRVDLVREMYDVDAAAIDTALIRLCDTGVVEAQDERVRAAGCLRYLDELGMVCI
jgi:hypothetical protein